MKAQPGQAYTGVAMPPMQPGQPMQPQPTGGAPAGLPPGLAAIWQHLPPQLQALLSGAGGAGGAGGGGNALAGLLSPPGGAGAPGGLPGGPGGGPLGGLLGMFGRPQQPAMPGKMIASGNPYPVPQTY